MPKPLREPPPSSSVARLLDLDAAARAVAIPATTVAPDDECVAAAQVVLHPARETTAERPTPARRPEHPHVKRELVLTPTADDTFTRLVEAYRRGTGTRLTASHVARAMLKGVAHCMDYLEKEARRIGPLKLPSNARGRELDRERFEARIADAFIAGIRSAPAMDEE